jgi:phosphate transport system substrate-binding protein
MRPLPALILSLCLLVPGALFGAAPDELPAYRPTRQVHGTIRSWGHGFLRPIMKRWADGFLEFQPDVRFQPKLVTSAAAIAGLYTQSADLGVLAREIIPSEVASYEKMSGQPVTPVTVMNGSWGNQDKIMALGIFVHRSNPLASLTLAQLDAIWGSELRRGAPVLVRTWDQLGLRGEWAGQPINPYTGIAYEAPGSFFSHAVMGGSVLWNCRLKQFENEETEASSPGDSPAAPVIHRTVDAYQRVVDAVASDRRGIGLSGAGYRNPNAKLIALAERPGGPWVEATPATIANGTYPLGRPVRFYYNNGPHLPPDPTVVEFLRYVLSREGQQQVALEGDFIPLTAAAAAAELKHLP